MVVEDSTSYHCSFGLYTEELKFGQDRESNGKGVQLCFYAVSSALHHPVGGHCAIRAPCGSQSAVDHRPVRLQPRAALPLDRADGCGVRAGHDLHRPDLRLQSRQPGAHRHRHLLPGRAVLPRESGELSVKVAKHSLQISILMVIIAKAQKIYNTKHALTDPVSIFPRLVIICFVTFVNKRVQRCFITAPVTVRPARGVSHDHVALQLRVLAADPARATRPLPLLGLLAVAEERALL